MALTIEDAHPVFAEVKKVRETLKQYSLVGECIPLSLDDLEYAIKQEYNAEIDKKVLAFKSKLVRGLIRIWDPRGEGKLFAQTVLDSELSKSQTRYVQTKELCHIIIHAGVNCTSDPTGIIQHFVQLNVKIMNGEAEALDVKNEMLADLAAYELLFPHDMRAMCRDEIEAGTESVETVAVHLGLPEHVVEQVLGNRYMKFAADVWGHLAA